MPKSAGAPIGVPPSNEAPAKKAIDPKVIGIGAFLLVGGVAAVFMSGMLGGGGSSDAVTIADPPAGPLTDPGVLPPPPVVAPPVMSAPPTGGGGGGAAPAPVAAPFQTVASPGGSYKTGTIGILMTNASSPAGAAKFAKNQFAKNGRWTNMQVAVFTDRATADAFGEYQRSQKNAPLTAAGFKRLSDMGVWNTTPAFLDSRGGQDKIYYPSQSPKSWWPNR